MFLFMDSLSGDLSEATGLVVSTESFPNYLETHPAVSTLPKSAAIGIKIGESSYQIDGRDVRSTNELPDEDIIVFLPEGYETIIGELGVCKAIKKAYNDDVFSIETHQSKAMLFLKYRKLLKYSECVN